MKALEATLPQPSKPSKLASTAAVDIGKYDGGFERDDDQPNKDTLISPEADRVLQLDSSTTG